MGAIVVIGASAGGVEALTSVVRGLPADLAAPVCVVLHTPPGGPSSLPSILERAGELPAAHARDGQQVEDGHILVAPPDRHLILTDGIVRVSRGPRENRLRPAVDTLFRSAAFTYGPSAIGVILSGALDDGAAGLEAIKAQGGSALIQDPADALFPGMPLSARERTVVDHARPAAELGPLISELVTASVAKGGDAMPRPHAETTPASPTDARSADVYDNPPGEPSPYSCPDCGGVLWRGKPPRDPDFACRVGHAYSAESLESAQRDGVEAALWTALRALEESALTTRRLATDAQRAGRHSAARRFAARRAQVEQQAAVLRKALAEGGADTKPPS